VQRPVEASGVGLHSGAPVHIRILPAPVSTGIVFVRTDLDNFPIPASWRHVARVSYATSLMHQGVLISTTEHLLSVFYSMGIDQRVRGNRQPEVPILDGSGCVRAGSSSRPAFASIAASAATFASAVRVSVEDRGKRIAILPDESFRLTCDTDYPHPVGRHSIELEVTPERYASEIAFARTFGWRADEDQLRNMGLIRGASLENCIAFDSGGVLNPEGLRAPDECCRHKALDLIGDLALLGRPLLATSLPSAPATPMHAAL